MRILILAVHFEVTGARYIADAFTRLNHDVRHDGRLSDLEYAWGVPVDPKYRWVSNTTCTWDLTVPIKDWKPDLIIIADTLTVDLIKDIHPSYVGIPLVVWSNDNHVRNVRRIPATHYFLAHAHGKAQPVSHDDESWLPCATDEIAFPPSPIAWDERLYDFCCIGVMYPERARRVQLLKDAGYKVFAATGLVYDEYRAAYQNSRIALCSSVAGDLAQRFFEGAGMGCLVFTDLVDDLVDDETNRKLGLSGFVSYNNDSELLSFAHSFLRDPAEITKGKYGAKMLQALVLAEHKWTDRAQVVVNWYNKEYGVTKTPTTPKTFDDGTPIPEGSTFFIPGEDLFPKPVEEHSFFQSNGQAKIGKPYLNLGCGRTHFPSAPPAGHELVDKAIYDYPLWVNVDKVNGVGADKVFDLFTYPWPLEDNSFDGALLAHICEHIPHEMRIYGTLSEPLGATFEEDLKPDEGHWVNLGIHYPSEEDIKDAQRKDILVQLQDGWYAFFSELYRVLTPGALVHIVSPYGFSDGGITDPTHHRLLTVNTFTHSMQPSADGSTFQYNNGGINFAIEGTPILRFTEHAELMSKRMGFAPEQLVAVFNNMAYDFYVKLKVIK